MKNNKKGGKQSNVLIKLAVWLCISMAVIGGMLMCEKHILLAEQQTIELTLNKKNNMDNAAFNVSNMFPGDAVERKYCIKVSYEDSVIVGFRVDIGKGYDKLAEVLKCKIVLSDTDELLYDGLMKDVPEALEQTLPYAEKGEVDLCYQITAYLDTSVGNTYQNTSLEADFVWCIEAEEQTDTDTDVDEPTIPDADDEGDDAGSVDEENYAAGIDAETGDDTNVVMWLALAVCAAAGFLVLIGAKKQKEGKDNEQ